MDRFIIILLFILSISSIANLSFALTSGTLDMTFNNVASQTEELNSTPFTDLDKAKIEDIFKTNFISTSPLITDTAEYIGSLSSAKLSNQLLATILLDVNNRFNRIGITLVFNENTLTPDIVEPLIKNNSGTINFEYNDKGFIHIVRLDYYLDEKSKNFYQLVKLINRTEGLQKIDNITLHKVEELYNTKLDFDKNLSNEYLDIYTGNPPKASIAEHVEMKILKEKEQTTVSFIPRNNINITTKEIIKIFGEPSNIMALKPNSLYRSYLVYKRSSIDKMKPEIHFGFNKDSNLANTIIEFNKTGLQ